MPELISNIMPRRGVETFLLAASVPNQQKDYILQKDAIISQCRLALFLTGCAHQRANRVVKTYCTD
ncbi:hypothetical protein IscW_ISCW008218 [Ixodes scapularis]|uniref:Uncharacterized protein n=1 Tax=Ixodes scapularis TaxID=6945 RepID=B7PUC3_IXOSC|nr:hypothetical protein IscW_ISCW008218 [Ixodes scapularis]|eukprot:XP_002405904.1 hypothetical protein IscW_ISCW008218 [Ixodes scapularis]